LHEISVFKTFLVYNSSLNILLENCLTIKAKVAVAILYEISYSVNVTRSALQYKALNTLGAHLRVVEKNSVNFLNISFLVKEGHNNKNLVIILFACSRKVRKSLQ